jgi:trimethylamine:corrinoid methyltransferase-like protein
MTTPTANKFTGAKAGGPRELAMGTYWAARFAQFYRWPA